jgi:3-oxoacyl-[acyl-carrier-protein] synthase-3
VAERLGLAREKIFVNLQRYGNTSAASCAIALCEAVEQGVIKKGDKVVLATFGSGLVWGAMVMEW